MECSGCGPENTKLYCPTIRKVFQFTFCWLLYISLVIITLTSRDRTFVNRAKRSKVGFSLHKNNNKRIKENNVTLN